MLIVTIDVYGRRRVLYSINNEWGPILMIMELPVLANSSEPGIEAIVRALKKANADVCGQSAERCELSCATAYHALEFPDIWDVNISFDIHLPTGMTACQVVDEIADHFRDHDATCYTWVPNDIDCAPALVDYFNSEGFECERSLCMLLTNAKLPEKLRDDVQIIPARAMRKPYGELHHRAHVHQWGEGAADQMEAVQMNGLDNPQLDAFVARVDKEVVASAGIYSLGEIGVVYEVVTHPEFRRQGIMKALLDHLLRHAARCQFKTMALETSPDNDGAIGLYESFGFEKVTEFPIYRKFRSDENTFNS